MSTTEPIAASGKMQLIGEFAAGNAAGLLPLFKFKLVKSYFMTMANPSSLHTFFDRSQARYDL
jgi:hypothetical protein